MNLIKLLPFVSLMLLAPSNLDLFIHHEGQAIMKFVRSDFEMLALPIIDEEKLQSVVQQLERKVYRMPKDAVIGQRGEIVPETLGSKLDRQKLVSRMEAFFYEGDTSVIETPMSPVYPKVDGELLAFIREKRIGSYVTYFNSRNRNRTHNIELAANAINNTVIFQGEQFSFNKVVGIRTSAKGYTRAPVIVRGELSEDIGGGICQVSSTLFNAIDRAGLRIIHRYSHSRSISYVPSGRDATVSWGGPDFVFQNVYDQPILIRASTGNGAMYVTIYSSEVIDFTPREVPGTTRELPDEVELQSSETGRSQPGRP
ncbi:MAG: VanW family protein [Candidatus Cohnella colombiensis]|uniref:VanW family protein n=1 Tax=Candidatus Cohnella colombiensis TaxID=3121368 RepID=A0AA95EYC6_9BACL|nr:MAG: VanW family protein [Cohnella sp.]